MLIKDHMAKSGMLLFRWRSYLPMVFLPFMAISLRHGEAVELRYGELWGDFLETAAVLTLVAGQLIRILTVGHVTNGTSGRNTHAQVADRLNVTGAYSLVRNPLYLGNCLMYLGAAAYTQDLILVVIMALALALYYERIISAEETFLAGKFGQAYTDWAARTPAFLPRLRGWRKAELPFSWRMVIRREHPSIYGALLTICLIDTGFETFGAEPEGVDISWLWIMPLATAAILSIKVLKRHTRLLDLDRA